MIKRLFKVLILASYCCINITYASDENLSSSLSPVTSPAKKAVRAEQQLRPVSNLTPQLRATLKKAGFSELKLLLINIAQTALYRIPCGATLEASSYFDKEELNKHYNDLSKLGDFKSQETIRQLIFNLKTLYPESIPLSTLSLNTTIHTPCIRFVFDNDRQAKEACAAIVDKTLFQHVTGLTYKEPNEEKETPEERPARRNIQDRIFRRIEAERGVSAESLSAQAEQPCKIWKEYFNYLELRKQAIDKGLEVKITAGEIENVFDEFVRPHYAMINVRGWGLFFNKNEIDLNRCNSNNVSNLVLLMTGEAPIGADGKPMNLHHLTRRQPGRIILVDEYFHQKFSGLLHLRSEQHMKQPEAINRHQFNWWKDFALKAIGEYISTTAAPVITLNVAKPVTAERRKVACIRPREAAKEASPIRMQVATQLFED